MMFFTASLPQRKPFHLSLVLLFMVSLFANYCLAEEEEKAPEEKVAAKTSQPAAQPATQATQASMSRAEIIAAPADLFQQHQSDLQHYINKTEELLIGTEKYTILFNTSSTPNNKGVFILLPDWQLPATSPKHMAFLRETLPAQGWATLILQPLNEPDNYPSNALEDKDRIQQNQDIITAYTTKLTEICQALMAKVANEPGVFIFVTEGNHAGLIFDVFNAQATANPHAIILLSAYRKTMVENETFAEKLAMSNIPVLDLYLKKDHLLVTESALMRKKQAEKELKVVYRQKQINNPLPSYYPEPSLLKEVQGWLKSIGW